MAYHEECSDRRAQECQWIVIHHFGEKQHCKEESTVSLLYRMLVAVEVRRDGQGFRVSRNYASIRSTAEVC